MLFIGMMALVLLACSNQSASEEGESEAETEQTTTETETNEEETDEEAEEEPESGGELRIAINAQPPTIDPLLTTATIARDVALQIFEPLVTINANLQPQPMLAESYELSEDGKTITFHLRKGVTFHNGKEMTAEDVVASMKRWQEYSSRAKAAFSEAEFVAEDDYTVLLNMPAPNRTAFSVLSSSTQFPAIMPKEVVESAGADGVTEFIGTGPFKFVEWKQDQYIHLTKNENYTPSEAPSDGPSGKREALVDDVYFIIATDSSTRIAGMQSGEYDIANAIPFNNYDIIENDDRIEAYMQPSGFNLIVFNKKQGPFAHQKIRQAVAAALDIDAILQASFNNEKFYELNPGIMLKNQTDWYSDAGNENYNQKDPEKAKQLLAEAGYNGEPVTFITSREYEDFYNSSVVVKEQLEAIGMTVNIEVFDWATVVEKQGDPAAYDAFITGFGINTDPTQFLFLDSKNEWAGWTNSEDIDRILDEIRGATSDEEAKAKAAELQKVIWEYVPVLKFGDKNFFYAVSKDIEGFQDVIGMMLWNVKKNQ